jgi:hypothetical protein
MISIYQNQKFIPLNISNELDKQEQRYYISSILKPLCHKILISKKTTNSIYFKF